jgi:predicted alpha/beta-fold hydrolase
LAGLGNAEDRIVEAAPDVRLLVRANWHAARAQRPTLVIVHGLGGSSESSYGRSLARLAFAAGWNTARMNLRGAGSGRALCARSYNAGLDSDVVTVLRAVAELTPRVALCGFSLGANLVALALGRREGELPDGLLGAAAVSPPLDLSACADALDAPRNRLYREHYLLQLRADYRERQRQRPDLYQQDRERGTRTIREFDDRITAPYGGYADAADYYARSSAGPHLASVRRPLLLLSADDDPMIPLPSVSRWPLPAGGAVLRQVTRSGGHVGFFARSRAPGRFWAADRVLEFLDGPLTS